MNWAGKQHPIEMVAEWAAPAVLAGALAWAAWTVGQTPGVSAAIASLAMAAGVAAIRRLGGSTDLEISAFEPAALDEPDELLLDQPLSSGELLLDDPLVDIAADSRVVKLFARQEPTPGELVLRISDYLNDSSRTPIADRAPDEPRHPDASAALHAALANIRASLR